MSKRKYFDHGASNPDAGPTAKPYKTAKVPRPRGDYQQAKVEHEGNEIVVIAPAPLVHEADRLPASPDSLNSVDRWAGRPGGRKIAQHGHHADYKAARGRDYNLEQVRDAVEVPGAAAKARKPQLGSNQRLGN